MDHGKVKESEDKNVISDAGLLGAQWRTASADGGGSDRGAGRYDIHAERKSIYADVETLRTFGMDIILRKDAPAGYYLASREFELAELKRLVDAVQASKFITAKKSEELIQKLEGLASHYEASQLQRQVYVANRIKTMNESMR